MDIFTYGKISSKKDAVELSKDARKVPYCLDTSIHDNFVSRIPTGDYSRTAINMKQAQEVKNIVEKDIESETCRGVLLDNTYRTDVAKAFAEEAELPLNKITPQDWIDKTTGKEYIGEAEHHIRKVVSQLEQKFKNTGERSVLLFQDIDKMCPRDAVEYLDKKSSYILLALREAKSHGIIPIMTTSSKECIDPAILKRLKVVE